MIEPLPNVSSISSSVLSFLDSELHTIDDLQQAPKLVSDLQNDCNRLDQSLTDLNQKLGTCLLAYSTYSDQVGVLFNDINAKLSSFQYSISDGEGEEQRERSESFLGKELPALAREVARVEAVRVYAETALKLDTLVGDIEDAVSSSVNRNLRKQTSSQNSEESCFAAINALKLAEDVLTKVLRTRPQWSRLISAVDHRVDRALAILRPQTIADYRSLLTSLNWPPPLSTLSHANPEAKKSAESTNPLLTMHGDLKHQYCDSFLVLCKLQELQTQRKFRQLQGHNLEITLHQPLWAIEELVNPISIASQHHFSKWADKPELIFALVYKITRDYVDSMDELLQPLVDQAMLSGYSCREEWISAMVTSLSTYMAKEIFPNYISQLDEENTTENRSLARISWLHFIDLMISFDKKVKSLVAQSGITLSLEEDGNMQSVSSLSVFCDRPDWLDLWAEIERSDAIDKLRPEIEDEKKWLTEVQESGLVLGSESYGSPAISSSFLRRLSSVIERCRSVPRVELRARFIRLAGAPIVHHLLDFLLLRCQEAEGLTALTDDDALIKVTKCINAARYFESVLKEWCEEVFFLEMELDNGGIIDEEISKLEKFRTEWVEKLTTVILRGFDACSRDYMKNKKQWTERIEEGWAVSRSFIVALDYLQAKMSVLELNLNKIDFVGVWRNLASAIDSLIFSGVFMSYAKFNDGGVERLANDLAVLFGVFKSWCLRPEGFFPKSSEGLKVLKMEDRQHRGSVEGGDRWLNLNGIRHLTPPEVERIVNSRVFG
ncbi:RINT1-like protein MAG2 [Rutidosis leptorrhynchoides]|uniref:RINT1-like protein MAG2 n=1 Tax=Rutidosis leptorrhynchoides TaxID=125765 RepID=UPI003A996D48